VRLKRDFSNLQGTLKPTVEDLANKGEAAVSDFTEDTLKPAAKKVAETAEPKTKEFTEKTLKPTAKQVQSEPLRGHIDHSSLDSHSVKQKR
jgi:hypothetical protein